MFRRRHRRRLVSRAFPESWLDVLEHNVRQYGELSSVEQARLRDALRIFLAEKRWEGCAGLRMTEEIQVTISALACLMSLGFEEFYFDGLKSILVYPGGYVVQDRFSAEMEVRVGEAHPEGPVIVSWWDSSAGPHHLQKISEVVFHEFAHLVDLLDHHVRSPGLFSDHARLENWRQGLRGEFERQVRGEEGGDAPVLSGYGAQDEHEFFAVATESFFVRPLQLRLQRPRLYEILSEWYRQDPARRADERGESEESKESPHQAIDRGPSIEDLGEAIRRHPDLADAYRQRALAYLDRGEHDRAIADYGEVLRLAPDSVDAHVDRGEAYLLGGDPASAIDDFNRAIQLCPDDPDAHVSRGRAYHARHEFPKALADFGRAIRLDPVDGFAFSCRGSLYLEMGKVDRAIRDFSRAIRLSPGDAGVYIDRGQAYQEKGDDERALADFDEAIRLDPASALAYSLRGDTLLDTGESQRAIEDYTEAIRLNPDASDYSQRAAARIAVGQLEEAIGDCDEALRRDPDLAVAYRIRGHALYHRAAYRRAIADCDEALRRDPQLAAAYHTRGLAHAALGAQAEAARDSARARELDEEFGVDP